VQHAVQQVGRPEGVERRLHDRVAQPAHRVEPAALGERQVADDGLLGRVGAAPVAGPAWDACQ
jgi:hypothetical protein